MSLQVPAGPGLFVVFQLKNSSAEQTTTTLLRVFGPNPDYKFVADLAMNRVLMRLPDPLESHAQAWFTVLEHEPHSVIFPTDISMSETSVEKIKEARKTQIESESPAK